MSVQTTDPSSSLAPLPFGAGPYDNSERRPARLLKSLDREVSIPL